MEITSKGFKKPADNEFYDIDIFNDNAQLTNDLFEGVDSAIGQKADSVNAELSGTARLNGKEIATTEKYVMQASDMRNGWILVHGNVLQKIGNRVFARFTISSGATAVNNVACNVPVGFRPSAETFITVKGNFDTSDNPVNQFMAVFPDGNIQIKFKDSKPNIFIETSWEV